MYARILIPLLGVALLSGCAALPTVVPAAPATPTPTKTVSAVRSVYGNVDVAISQAQSDARAHVDLTDPSWMFCASDLYPDVNAGAQVTVKDAKGTVIGVGALETGTNSTANGVETCQFHFVVENVPLEGDFFSVQIGNEIRGTTQFTLREMQVGPRLFLG